MTRLTTLAFALTLPVVAAAQPARPVQPAQPAATRAPEAAAPATNPPAPAQTPPEADAEFGRVQALEDARAIVVMLGFQDRVPELLTVYRNTIVTQATISTGRPAAEVAPLADDFVVPAMKAHIPELLEKFAEIWVDNLSGFDLHSLRAHLAIPAKDRPSLQGTLLGRRIQEALGKIENEETRASTDWGQRVGEDAMKQHAAEIKARGLPN